MISKSLSDILPYWKAVRTAAGFTGDAAIRNGALSRSIETAQKRVEGNNYDVRKTLLEYDNVINEQREAIYELRNNILDSDDVHDIVTDSIKNYVDDIIFEHLLDGKFDEEDIEEITAYFKSELNVELDEDDFILSSKEETADNIYEKVMDKYDTKLEEIPDEIVNDFEKAISLRVIDTYWMEHINTMSHLREGIHLRGYAQENPLRA